MESTINKIMNSRNIAAAAKRYGLGNDEMWNLYYESGILFLECLKVRIKHKRVFDHVLKPFSSQIGNMSLPEVFKMIEYSPSFWKWWANHLWCVCYNCKGGIREMIYSVIYDNVYFPNFTLKNIINDKNKQKEFKAGYARQEDSTRKINIT